MSDRELFRAVFIRHGHTEYTDIPPDITPQGQNSLHCCVGRIKNFAGHRPLHVRTSPKVRAIGSGKYLSQFLDIASISQEHALGAVHLRHARIGQQIFSSYLSANDPLAVEKAYWTHPEFDDADIFEPRLEIRQRILAYVSGLVDQHSTDNEGPCYVCVSHVETLCHLVDQPFSLNFSVIDPVKCAEPFFMIARKFLGSTELFIEFRGIHCTRIFGAQPAECSY